MRAGKKTRYVTLANSPTETNDADGYYEPLSPEGDWVSIEALSPGNEGGVIQSYVSLTYRPDVTVGTRIVYVHPTQGTRRLFVRGIQPVGDHDEDLRLLCDEAIQNPL